MKRTSDQADRGIPRRGAAGVVVTVSGRPGGLDRAIRRVAREVLRREGIRRGQLDVAVVGAAIMSREHLRWLGLAGETDVMAFDLGESRRPGHVDGQIIVCATVAKRLARAAGRDWRRELLLYVAHGCLHLCGYDDHRPQDAARMHRREDEILTALGFGAVYSSGGECGGDRRGAPARRPLRRGGAARTKISSRGRGAGPARRRKGGRP